MMSAEHIIKILILNMCPYKDQHYPGLGEFMKADPMAAWLIYDIPILRI